MGVCYVGIRLKCYLFCVLIFAVVFTTVLVSCSDEAVVDSTALYSTTAPSTTLPVQSTTPAITVAITTATTTSDNTVVTTTPATTEGIEIPVLPQKADGVCREIVLEQATGSAATTNRVTLIDTYEDYLQAEYLADLHYSEAFFEEKQIVFLQYLHGGRYVYLTTSALNAENGVLTLTVELEATEIQSAVVTYMLVAVEVEKKEEFGEINSANAVYNKLYFEEPPFPIRSESVCREIILDEAALHPATTEQATLIDTYEKYLQADFLADTHYTEDFFEEKQLVFLQYEHGGGTLYRTTTDCSAKDGVLTLTVDVETMRTQTTQTQYMLVLLEVEKNEAFGEINSAEAVFNVSYRDEAKIAGVKIS